ncbi:MAG: hypothetical protein L0387_15515 [Acidobacteria bacterium]|nr:hypothetical protein [Acidobacteriota bacterium]
MRLVLAVLGWMFLSAVGALAAQDHRHEPMGQEKLGSVKFPVSCSAAAQKSFERAVAMLHSFWYEEAEREFTSLAGREPSCGMAYWGIAMSLYHPLWYPPAAEEFARAAAALKKAGTLPPKTEKERGFLSAINKYFADDAKSDHRTRALAYEQEMERLHQNYPQDREAALFYALALLGTASPRDKSFANQKKAGAILEKVFAEQPLHPGVAHYLIHSYDYPELADRGLAAARAYAKIAPGVPHALHMPSHIFVRLGLWEEAIASNVASAEAARQYARHAKMDGSWDQELHAMDYLVYSYLQLGREADAKQVVEHLSAVKTVSPPGTTGDYAWAAIPARFCLEREDWLAAASLPVRPSALPESRAITHWARAFGAARVGKLAAAQADLAALEQIVVELRRNPKPYPWHDVVEVQRLQAAGWIALAEGKRPDAIQLLRAAANLEDAIDKHPVTPGPVVPAHEQLGYVLLEAEQARDAEEQFRLTLAASPNRGNALRGLRQASAKVAQTPN